MIGMNLLKKYSTSIFLFTLVFLIMIIISIHSTVYYSNIGGYPLLSFEDSYHNLNKILLIDSDQNYISEVNIFDSPFLYSYWIILFSEISGLTIFTTMILFNVLFIFIFSLVLFVFLIKISNVFISFFSTLLFISNPFSLVIFSEPIRIMQIIFISIVSFIFYYYFLEKNKKYYLVTSGLILSIGFLIHYSVILFVIPLIIHILIYTKFKFRNIFLFISYFSIIPVIWYILKQTLSVSQSVDSIPLFTQYKEAFLYNLNTGFSNTFGFEFFQVISNNLGSLGVLILVGSFIESIYILRNYNKEKYRSLIIFSTLVILLFFILAYPSHSHYSRYPVFTFYPLVFLCISFFYRAISKINHREFIICLISLILLISIFTQPIANIYSYKNQYVSRIETGIYIGSHIGKDSFALEGWPSTLMPIINEEKLDRISILGFDLDRNLTKDIDKNYIQEENIGYFVYEQVTCFNNQCPNQYYLDQFNRIGYILSLEKEINDPISKARFIKVYKIVEK